MTSESNQFVNREISWLSFNSRVLQEAQDLRVPLLERLKFLGIFSSNLDEFYRVRVANVQREIDLFRLSGLKVSKYGYDPSELMDTMQQIVVKQRAEFERTYKKIKNELSKDNIFIVDEHQLSDSQGGIVREYFRKKVLRKLVPLIIEEGVGKFPFLTDNVIYLAVKLSDQAGQLPLKYALIELPTSILPRFFVFPKEGQRTCIMLLDDVIRYSLEDIFTVLDYDQFEAYTIKVSRDAELDLDYDISKSFLERMSKSLKFRKSGRPVRLTYDRDIHPDMLKVIRKGLNLKDEKSLLPGERYHNFKDFIGFPAVGKKSFFYPAHVPQVHPKAPKIQRLFDILAKGDLLLHYPYHTFDYTVELLREAAIDPYVKEIRLTIYRFSEQSSLIHAIRNAHKNGKDVVIVIELQARFDEAANIKLANSLIEQGIKVIQGVPGLKVHGKLVYIMRKRQKKVERYGIIATGNFHEKTAKLYSDMALFTSNRAVLKEVKEVFDFFEANYRIFDFKHLLVAPMHMRDAFYKLIDQEIALAKRRRKAYIHVKLNSLVDEEMIEKLYEASQSGVKIKMIIRGICSLRPGIKGLSENIEVLSIVDKFLEHTRVMVFGNGGSEKFYISSGDWMQRNLNRRVEVAVPIYDEGIKEELRDFFNIQWRDNSKARVIDPKQLNKYRNIGQRKFRAQTTLEKYYMKKLEG